MRFFAKLFLFASLVAAGPAWSAPEGAAEFMKKSVAAQKWDQLLTAYRGSLTPLVFKELTALVEGLPYPTIRTRRGSLWISNENGEHMTVVLLQKDGEVLLNGKAWKLDPLATPAVEVKRIADLLGGGARASVMDLVVPSAHAGGGLGMTMGVAAAAYASSATWKAEACARKDIPDSMVGTCTLMGVSMSEKKPIDSKATDPKKLLPIKLVCPQQQKDPLILISKNQEGDSEKIVVEFDGDSVVQTSYEVAPKGYAFTQIFKYSFRGKSDEKIRPYAEKLVEQGNELRKNVCIKDPENKEKKWERYNLVLSANAKSLQVSSAEIETPNTRGSKSGL